MKREICQEKHTYLAIAALDHPEWVGVEIRRSREAAMKNWPINKQGNLVPIGVVGLPRKFVTTFTHRVSIQHHTSNTRRHGPMTVRAGGEPGEFAVVSNPAVIITDEVGNGIEGGILGRV